MKFYRTIEQEELKTLAGNVLSATRKADADFKAKKDSLDIRLHNGEITAKFHADSLQSAIEELESSYHDTAERYAPAFDRKIRMLNQLAEQVKAPEISQEERNALDLLKSMTNPTQAALDAARDAWNGNPISQGIMQQVADKYNLIFTSLPRTVHLTAADVQAIAKDIQDSATMYFKSHRHYLNPDDRTGDNAQKSAIFLTDAERTQSEADFERLTRTEPFEFGGSIEKHCEFDSLCDTANIAG